MAHVPAQNVAHVLRRNVVQLNVAHVLPPNAVLAVPRNAALPSRSDLDRYFERRGMTPAFAFGGMNATTRPSLSTDCVMNLIERRDPTIDFSSLSKAEIAAMQAAADEMIGVLEEAAEQEKHILIDILNAANDEPFTEWEHYPPGDVQDRDNGALWFYHAHAKDDGDRPWDEHGHFHTFVYSEHVQDGVQPIALPSDPDYEKGGLCHLIAISFDNNGAPVRVFTTNRWVAAEWLYPADEVIRLLDKFVVETKKFPLTTRWLMAAMKLFRPQIEWSLRERDAVLEQVRADDPEGFSENENYEVLSSFPFDLAGQIDALENSRAELTP